jgi:hypothetical protein
VRVRTRAYFAVQSDVMPPDVLALRIGAEPSRATVRGARRERPPIPASHGWALDSGLPVEEPLWRHLEALYERVGPLVGAIGELCADEPVAVLRIVREFEPDPEEADLGFRLGREWLDLLRRTGANVDVDEYDYASG